MYKQFKSTYDFYNPSLREYGKIADAMRRASFSEIITGYANKGGGNNYGKATYDLNKMNKIKECYC